MITWLFQAVVILTPLLWTSLVISCHHWLHPGTHWNSWCRVSSVLRGSNVERIILSQTTSITLILMNYKQNNLMEVFREIFREIRVSVSLWLTTCNVINQIQDVVTSFDKSCLSPLYRPICRIKKICLKKHCLCFFRLFMHLLRK